MRKFMAAATLAVLLVSNGARAQITGFDDILAWAGTGSNRSALVFFFNDGEARQAFAFGYRWSGSATAEDMLTALDGLFGLTLQSPAYVNEVTFLDAVSGVTHSRAGGAFTDYPTDWLSWGYYLAGGSATIFDSAPPYGPVGTATPPGGGVSLPSTWTTSPAGSASRQLADGSWDAFSFGQVDTSFNHVTPPAGAVYSAVPEPSAAWLAVFGAIAICGYVKRRVHTP